MPHQQDAIQGECVILLCLVEQLRKREERERRWQRLAFTWQARRTY